MTETKNSRKKVILAVSLAVVLILSFSLIYHFTRQAPDEGMKTIKVSIVFAENDVKPYTIKTDAEYLRQALEEKGLVAKSEPSFIKTIDGVTADDGKDEWWKLCMDGEMLNTGFSETPLKDGDSYEIILTAGFDFDF